MRIFIPLTLSIILDKTINLYFFCGLIRFNCAEQYLSFNKDNKHYLAVTKMTEDTSEVIKHLGISRQAWWAAKGNKLPRV